MPNRQPAAEPGLFIAIKWLFITGCAAIMFLGGISFLIGVGGKPTPAPTVTVTETQPIEPSLSTDIPDGYIEDALSSMPAPSACTDADDRGVIPRDRWTPCGQVLGYFDDWTTPPPGAPVVP
ncbi:hypothetical protein [Streptomyces sp. NBC_01235]|uniref:hypothetical protein n=1 Tax=Streptomyces sp. NBC_01235 TaxID=2903788 RepID=UPI002E129579|nr:hypothetical protein OG289_42120 [Streptomyces sp. NBC_01235]